MDNLYPRTRFWLTAAIALGALAVTGWFCALGEFAALLGWLTGCGLAGILVNLPAIESFALTKDGLSAKMRATLAEAAATIDQLRALATSTARSSLTQSMAGLLGPRTMQISERLRLDLKVIDELRRLEATDAQMREARELWDRGVGVLFGRQLHSLMDIEAFARHRAELSPPDNTHYVGDRPIHRARAELMGAIDFENWYAPAAQDLRDLCASAEGIVPGADELLAAYESFERAGTLDRPELLDPPS
jgi:hypothetical protein